MRHIYFYVLLCFLSCACHSTNTKLETALQLAGNNRVELEKILRHYSLHPADSLKLRAAEFLIANMPGHYTLEGTLINEYREKIYADTTSSYFAQKALDISLGQIDWIREASYKEEDIERMKADFLIRHIDRSFELYEYTWLADFPIDMFLEYILPYRFENERLDLWRDSLHIAPDLLHALSFEDNTKYTVSKMETNLRLMESQVNIKSHFILELFKQDIYSDCHHITLKENFKSRVSSFPAVIDFIPHYANRNGYHYWNTILSPESKTTEVRGAFERKTAKVFRKTYSSHDTPVPGKTEYIPEFFQNPFYKDVSDDYLYTAHVTIHSNKKLHASHRHAYLCIFNDLSWIPIAIGDIKDSQAEFKAMGKNLVYLPVYYMKNKMQSLNYPFVLNLKGEVKYLIPDTSNRQAIILKRKYPFNGMLHNYNELVENMIIEASNRPDFRGADTILSRLDIRAMAYSEGEVKTDKKYRYWRISHPTLIDFSELLFIDPRGNLLNGNVDSTHVGGMDKNPLSNVNVGRNDHMKIDFCTPVEVSRIVCIPRGDGNGIFPGNEYELFYHDVDGWQSLGRKIPTDCYLEYDIPAGALLWLHNHTTGIEERIFTYFDNAIRFW